MNKFQQDTTEFHKAFGHPAPDESVLEVTPEIRQLMVDRADWLIEEAEELKAAAEAGDLLGIIDALGDSSYFSVGGFTVLGHDMERFWDNIHGSNMEKLDEHGKPVPHPTIPNKIGKPDGWVPPEAKHAALLAEISGDPAETF